ncbi:MAG TPA: hypothetical protein PLV84_12350 [Deltaproteobacteria bacterium]|nr:hypothetical protein [Deltaproteobacteria bacterium]
MGFIRMNGVEGLIYVPEDTGGAKKYPCPDCYCCQWCSDNRCDLCLRSGAGDHDPALPAIIPLTSIVKK